MAALPFAANTTCDIFRSGRNPPSAPDVAGVPIYLVPRGRSTLTTQGSYSHVAYMPVGTDVRDSQAGPSISPVAGCDQIFVPNSAGSPVTGTAFKVCLVRRYGWGTGVDHLEVLLARQTIANPPTSYL